MTEWRFCCWDNILLKNIPQHQQFVDSLAELLEPIRIPSSVMTFALIRSLVLWGKVVSLPHHGSFPVAEYECLWIRVSCVKEGGCLLYTSDAADE